MPIAKLTELKTRLGISGASEDALLTQALDEAGAAVEQECHRTILYPAADVTELHDGGRLSIWTYYWPIVTVTSIKEADDYDFAAADALVADEDYHALKPRGRIIRMPSPEARFADGPGTVQLVYRGGYNDPAATAIVGVDYVPVNIQKAVLIQAAHLYQRRHQIGAGQAGMQSVSVAFTGEIRLLLAARELLIDERRMA